MQKSVAGRAFRSYQRSNILKAIFASALALMIATSGANADPAGELLEKITALDNSEIKEQHLAKKRMYSTKTLRQGAP